MLVRLPFRFAISYSEILTQLIVSIKDATLGLVWKYLCRKD